MAAVLQRPPARPAAAPAPPEASPQRGRLRCIDVLRGLAVLGMILVNNQGSGAHAFWGMSHADWSGWSLADMVFPTFLFVVGASMALSMARKPMTAARAVRRAVLLFAIGFGLNALPPTVLGEVRIMGVLQRIGLTFLLAYLVVRWLPVRRQVVVGAVALVGYWLLVSRWPITPQRSLPGIVDRFLLGPKHVYKNGGYDPEGLFSTIPATVSVLAGYWTVCWLRIRPRTIATVRRLALVGLGVAAAGQLWGVWFPVNKRLWTSSYVLLMAGLGMVLLATCIWATDLRQARSPRPGRTGAPSRRFDRAMQIFGVNALIVFAGSEILTGQLKAHGARVFLYDHVYAPYLGFLLGSLVYGLVITAVWWLVAWAMWRRRWFVKV